MTISIGRGKKMLAAGIMTQRRYDLKDFPRLTAGLVAIILSVFFICKENSTSTLLASAFFILICTTDTLQSRIPNLYNLALAITGFGYQAYSSGVSGIPTALFGLLLGFSLLFPFYLLGGMGAGDVKALAALGALVGPHQILNVFFYMGIAGGILACLHYVFNRNLAKKFLQGLSTLKAFAYTREIKLLKPAATGEKLRFPYASAIAFGFFAYLTWGSIF
jgi:prepilin peptidase CpaA